LSDPHWLSFAKTLPAGRSAKIECCAADKSLMVSNDTKGYRAYCFRCGPVGFVAHGLFNLDELKRRKAELEMSKERVVKLPSDFTTDIPPSEAVWLYKAGISPQIAKHYKFGYSPFLRRVILPIYNNGVLQGYTARSTINARPKYIEKVVDTSSTVFCSDASIQLPWPDDRLLDSIPDCVLVEDILSAVRVGRFVRCAVALLGTSLSGAWARNAHVHTKISVWLDPDKAGKKGAQAISKSLGLEGYGVKIIRSDKDPKYYSNREIRRFLVT
jgi:hypothetical protein